VGVIEVKMPRSSCVASSIPKEEEVYSRLLTPKQASGNAQILGLKIRCLQSFIFLQGPQPS
jgi:hypothetical protein